MLRPLGLGLLAFAVAFLPGCSGQPAPDNCPLSFTATGQEDGSAIFHWSGFGGADGYQVFGRAGYANTAGYSPMLDGNARDFTATNLATGDYTFWVVAYHSGSIVASSCERTTHVGPTLAAPCPAPVYASAQVDGTVLVSWPSIYAATGYTIARSVDGGTLDDSYASVNATTLSFVDADVAAGHTYTYHVMSQNTRLPPMACEGVSVTLEGAAVPFFPTAAGALAAVATCAGVVLLMARRRTE